MKVTILSNIDHNNTPYKTGEVADLPDRVVEQLTKDGVVKLFEEKVAAKTKTKTPVTPDETDETENNDGQEDGTDENVEDKPRNRMTHPELIAYGESKLGLTGLDQLANRSEVLKAVTEAEKSAESKK